MTDRFVPVCIVAIGYIGDSDTLPEGLKIREKAPRIRLPLEQQVFSEHWQCPAPQMAL